MSNVNFQEPPYFDNLRELMRHAENLGDRLRYETEELTTDVANSTRIYERDALENFIGEANCVINEARRRIRYLETVLANDV